MARAHLIHRVEGLVNGALVALNGASVTVYELGTTTPVAAPMFNARSGGTTLGNPITADTRGIVEAWMDADQPCTLLKTAAGYANVTEDAEFSTVDTLTNPTILGGANITGAVTLTSTDNAATGAAPALTTTQTVTTGNGAEVPIGLLGQVTINSGTHDHSIGVAGRCLPSATSPLGNGYYGVEGRVDVGRTGGVGYGTLGLASVANAASNAGSIVVGLRGRAEVLSGTDVSATLYGGWFTTNAPPGAVGPTYANAVFGDASNNVSTRFRGRATGGARGEALATVLANGMFEWDVTDTNLSNSFKVKLGASGLSRFSIFNSVDAEQFYIANNGNVVLATGSLQVGGNIGFYGTAPVAKPTVSGSKGGNAALGSLMTALASQGLVTDSTT